MYSYTLLFCLPYFLNGPSEVTTLWRSTTMCIIIILLLLFLLLLLLERLHFVLRVCGRRYPRQFAEWGSRSRDGLCIVWCAFQVRTNSPSRPCWWFPVVSAAIGTKKDESLCDEYLFVLLSAAASAAAPGVLDVSCTYDWASVSLTVTSHVTHFPCFHGSSVSPSGRFPSVLSRPNGSFNAGISAFAITVHTRSYRLWCLADRPFPPLHARPCSPLIITISVDFFTYLVRLSPLIFPFCTLFPSIPSSTHRNRWVT